MMEDWTDIIGEELENIEEPLPADDWSVLQQKYAAAQRKKRAAAFAWAGGITSVAAAVALVLLLVRPDPSSFIPGSTGGHNDLVAESLPPIEEVVPLDSSHVESPIDTAHYVTPSVQKKVSVPVDVVKKSVDDVLIAENNTEEITTENTEEVFDVIRDTTSLKDKLLADASTTPKNDPKEEEYAQATGSFGFDDFPDDEPRRKRRPMSIGISGSTSDTPVMKVMGDLAPEPSMDHEPPKEPDDSLATETPQPTMAMMRAKSGYSDSYQHEIPVSVGLSARVFLTDRLSINTGLNYTRYKSLRTRWFVDTHDQQKDWQYAHYIGVPVRLDYNAVNRKHFNLYFGAGLQMDKCVYATVGDERLHEKQILFGLNGAMGLQVNIVPMVGLYFEPEVSYALNKGSIETFRSDEPFVVTVRGGLRFNF
ncbi:MAG: outer membrane beta-barrel protein [Bacteroidales bacterium]|nr:outer membrane beta-barrel protein [Bacteroidales bacterium]